MEGGQGHLGALFHLSPWSGTHRWGAAGLTRADNLCQVRAKWVKGVLHAN